MILIRWDFNMLKQVIRNPILLGVKLKKATKYFKRGIAEVMSDEKKNCPVCGTACKIFAVQNRFADFYNCPVCGRFELEYSDRFNYNKLAPYFVYNGFKFDGRYYTSLNKELCDKYEEAYKKGDRTNGRPVHLDDEIIQAWYPKSFSERIDLILLYLNKKTKHIGQQVQLEYNELLSVMFVDRKEYIGFEESLDSCKNRNDGDCEHELMYILNYLEQSRYIDFLHSLSLKSGCTISLTPIGYTRIDDLQKNTSRFRKVLVAMKFGDETKNLREAIRKGICDAGYEAIFIDEVQHNDFITPELLKHIRDSKFVVADLTHKNNGAYFEEGYAMGLGKPVIQLCKKGVKLHFDIAQKNTIMWNTEEDIPERLTNRIKATID